VVHTGQGARDMLTRAVMCIHQGDPAPLYLKRGMHRERPHTAWVHTHVMDQEGGCDLSRHGTA
jgi:hypothetical protein